MKTLFKSIVTIFLVLCGTIAFAQKNTAMAVLDFETDGVSKYIGKAVSDIITTEISKKKDIKIIERTQIGVIIDEQGFQGTGCAESTCAVKIGKILSANKILLGSVVKMGGKYIITGKVVDVETGQLDHSENEGCYKEEEIENASQIVALKLLNQITGKSYPVNDIRDSRDEERNRFSAGVAGIYGKMLSIVVPHTNPNGGINITDKTSKKFRGINVFAGYDFTDYLTINLDGSSFYVHNLSSWVGDYRYDFNTQSMYYIHVLQTTKLMEMNGYTYSIDAQLNRRLKNFTTSLIVGLGNTIDQTVSKNLYFIGFYNIGSTNIYADRTIFYEVKSNRYNIFGKTGLGISVNIAKDIEFIIKGYTKYVFYEKTKITVNKTKDNIFRNEGSPVSESATKELTDPCLPDKGTHEHTRRNFFSEYSVSAGFLFRIF